MGAAGVFRTRGGTDTTELWRPPAEGMSDELVQVGGALFVAVGEREVWHIPMDGTAPRAIFTAPEDNRLETITAGGGWIHAALHAPAIEQLDAGFDVVSIDPTTGRVARTLHTAVRMTALAADDTALYFADDDHGWIVRAPHPPPAAPPP
jgi:hypothetical protein